MKKLVAALCCFLFLFTLMPATVFAEGDGNMDGGGDNGWGTGTASSKWSPGYDGVRVTVVDAGTGAAIAAPVDFTNRSIGSVVHFGKTNKIDYRNGAGLSPASGGYTYSNPARPLPTIISLTGASNIQAIKRYWCSEYAATLVAGKTGVPVDALISGTYKLLIEPMSYFWFNSVMYAMTATEVAMYDNLASGRLRYALLTMSHTNLPLAIFLERPDLGFAPWTGSKTSAASNANIITYLGIGIVSYTDADPWGDMNAPDYEYRVDTDVITSITLSASTKITPDNPATITFNIGARGFTVSDVVIPEGESQLVWVKWHTPSTPQVVNISVSASGGTVGKASMVANIVDLSDNTPPDPTANDTYPGFSVPAVPSPPQFTYMSWGVWSSYWEADWQWHANMQWVTDPCVDSCPDDCDGGHGHWEDNGEWVDEGDWEYEWTGYSARLSGTMDTLPDDIVPTATGSNMKSGYGIKTNVTTSLSTDAPTGHYTTAQTAITYFPEFNYNFYCRLLQRNTGGRNAQFGFKTNEFSTYNRNVHFLPVWYPDGTHYTVHGQVWDAWTPAGMLSINTNGSVTISGSLFDDWYTNRE